MPDWLTYVGPPLLVLTLLAGTLYVLTRINKVKLAQEGVHFKVTRLHSFGPRQQIVVVEYQEECYLLGVTQYTITSIGKLDKRPIEGIPPDEEVLS